MVAVGHPLVSLRRFERSEVPAPLTDAEFEELVTRLPTVEAHWRDNMRYRVNQTIEMLRVNGTFCDDGRQCYRGWLTHQLKRGTFLIFVNFFRELEGLPALQSLPELPNSRHMVRPRDANGKVCD